MSAAEILQIAKAGWLETVTLNRPERLNAINQPLADALLAYFESKRRDTDTRVISWPAPVAPSAPVPI